MTPLPQFDGHHGRHCAPPGPLAQFFRRLLPARWLRKQAAPESPSARSGAATALVAARQQAHADAMHELSKRYLPAPPRQYRGTQPRRHPDTQPVQLPAALRTVPVQPVAGRPPWETAPMPVYGQAPQLAVMDAEMAAEADRAAYVKSQMSGAVCTRDPQTLRLVLDGLQSLDGGLSPDCGNGCHAPLCNGRNCTCDCHGRAA